ncbi:4'-phosphopantetheinyl transferase superfamily protein [Actinomadura keratinilytica]
MRPRRTARPAPPPPRVRERELLRLWTLKEAYSKALGLGLRLGFGDFSVSDGGTNLLAPDDTAARPGAWAFATHQVLGGHLLSVARHEALPQPPPPRAAGTSSPPPARLAEPPAMDGRFRCRAAGLAESRPGAAPGPLEKTRTSWGRR